MRPELRGRWSRPVATAWSTSPRRPARGVRVAFRPSPGSGADHNRRFRPTEAPRPIESPGRARSTRYPGRTGRGRRVGRRRL